MNEGRAHPPRADVNPGTMAGAVTHRRRINDIESDSPPDGLLEPANRDLAGHPVFSWRFLSNAVMRALSRSKNSLPRNGERSHHEGREEAIDGTVQIRGAMYPVKNWSSRGFLAAFCGADCKVADRVNITFAVPSAAGNLEFDCRAIVVRVDKDTQQLAGVFISLDESAQKAISVHFGNRS